MKQIQEQVWQHSPKENRGMENNPVKECKPYASLELFGSNFPSLRFACPSCGTLDVFVSRKETSQQMLQVNCLDCKKTWSEEAN